MLFLENSFAGLQNFRSFFKFLILSLESCSRGCMKKILPLACGEKSFSLYTNINDMANIVQSLTIFETKPPSENGILCIDRPIPETPEEETEDYEDEK